MLIPDIMGGLVYRLSHESHCDILNANYWYSSGVDVAVYEKTSTRLAAQLGAFYYNDLKLWLSNIQLIMVVDLNEVQFGLKSYARVRFDILSVFNNYSSSPNGLCVNSP